MKFIHIKLYRRCLLLGLYITVFFFFFFFFFFQIKLIKFVSDKLSEYFAAGTQTLTRSLQSSGCTKKKASQIW